MQNAAFDFLVCVRQPYPWSMRYDEDVGRCHCILMLFFLAYPVEPTEITLEKESINAEMMLFMPKPEPSRSHRMHILHIF